MSRSLVFVDIFFNESGTQYSKAKAPEDLKGSCKAGFITAVSYFYMREVQQLSSGNEYFHLDCRTPGKN